MPWDLKPVKFKYDDNPTGVHADGNAAAWICPQCQAPVLFMYHRGGIVSSNLHRATCPGCGYLFFLTPPCGFLRERKGRMIPWGPMVIIGFPPAAAHPP